MIQTTTGYFRIGDEKLYYEMAGEGENLVLSHAGFVDSRMWDDQWDEFAQAYHVIRFDMRGFGKSDPVRSPVSRRDDLYRLLQYLGVGRAHLLGCSMSGTAVLDFTLEHPDMVSSLILVSADPSGFEMRGAPPRYLLEMIQATKEGDLARASDLQVRIWADGPFREPDQVNPEMRQRVSEMNRIAVKNGTWTADSHPLDPLQPPAVERLHEVHVPTLVIVGELDDPELRRASNLMASEIPGAQQVIIPGAAHVPNMDDPEMFNRVVLDFLAGLKT